MQTVTVDGITQPVLTYVFGAVQSHARGHIGDAEHAINVLREQGVNTTSEELERRGIEQGRERTDGHLVSGREGRSYQVASRYCVGGRRTQWPAHHHLYSDGDYSTTAV